MVGDYRREHLFTLQQSVAAYRQCQQVIAECDQEIHRELDTLPSKTDVSQAPLPPAKSAPKKRKFGEPDYDLRPQHYRILVV